jgi:hypothetical protein
MKIFNWKRALVVWGLLALAFFVLIRPRPAAPSPFSSDEAWLAGWVVAIFEALCFFVLPPAILWMFLRRDSDGAPDDYGNQ